MFVVAYMGHFSSNLLFCQPSHLVQNAVFDLAAAQYAGASISLFSVFLGGGRSIAAQPRRRARTPRAPRTCQAEHRRRRDAVITAELTSRTSWTSSALKSAKTRVENTHARVEKPYTAIAATIPRKPIRMTSHAP
jgi:hypothetical protein